MAELEIHHEGHESDPIGKTVGVLAAVLAVFLAIVTIESHRTHTAAIMHKSTANDDWSYYQANSIKLHNVELGEGLLSVLDAKGAQIKVSAAGTVPASAIGVFEVPGAAKQGENLYTGNAAGKPTGTVRQGSLEGSGVDAAKVMIEMITAMRSFQSGQQSIQTIAQTMQESASEVGSLNPS